VTPKNSKNENHKIVSSSKLNYYPNIKSSKAKKYKPETPCPYYRSSPAKNTNAESTA
jgi:hypothetical protein